MRLTWQVLDAPARTPFRIVRHTYTSFPLVRVTLEHDGRTGHGEAPPNRYYGETAETVTAVLPALTAAVGDPWDWQGWQDRARQALRRGHPAARHAVESALLDWCGRSVGLPVWRLLGLSEGPVPPSSASLGIDTPDATEAAARGFRAEGWQRLKVKLGWGAPDDEAALLVRLREALPDVALTVDANGGWSRHQARAMLPVLSDVGVELLEQPLPAGDDEGAAEVTRRSGVPVVLDESVTSVADVRRLAAVCDGVNVKISKLGGPLASLAALRTARELGLMTMIGCMGESSVSLAPAVHLAPLVDCVDLFGPHALAKDPAVGLSWQGPVAQRPTTPGWGVVPA